MIKQWLLFSCIFVSSVQAQQIQQSKTTELQPNDTTAKQAANLVFIDTSKQSKSWLAKHHQLIIAKKIPVLIIDGSQQFAIKLNKQYPGLQSGPAPKPAKFLPILMKELGVKKIPAMVINGQVASE